MDSKIEPVAGLVPTEGLGHMRKISNVIAQLQHIQGGFGDTCVYIRRGGMAWGSVALNWEADDARNGVFDLQAEHDRVMGERLEQIDRLIADKREAASTITALREEVARLKTQIAAVPRSATAQVLNALPNRAVFEVKDLTVPSLSRRQIYSALTYLAAQGHLTKIGYGKYQRPPDAIVPEGRI